MLHFFACRFILLFKAVYTDALMTYFQAFYVESLRVSQHGPFFETKKLT
jgi:hypothetical protein